MLTNRSSTFQNHHCGHFSNKCCLLESSTHPICCRRELQPCMIYWLHVQSSKPSCCMLQIHRIHGCGSNGVTLLSMYALPELQCATQGTQMTKTRICWLHKKSRAFQIKLPRQQGIIALQPMHTIDRKSN